MNGFYLTFRSLFLIKRLPFRKVDKLGELGSFISHSDPKETKISHRRQPLSS